MRLIYEICSHFLLAFFYSHFSWHGSGLAACQSDFLRAKIKGPKKRRKKRKNSEKGSPPPACGKRP
jgi:hypothetical protein